MQASYVSLANNRYSFTSGFIPKVGQHLIMMELFAFVILLTLTGQWIKVTLALHYQKFYQKFVFNWQNFCLQFRHISREISIDEFCLHICVSICMSAVLSICLYGLLADYNETTVITMCQATDFLHFVLEAQENQWERPENTSSIVGSNVTLKCSSPSGDCSLIEWLKQDGHPATVFSDRGIIASAYRSRYRVDNFSGCDLVIEDVELRDAGRFICRAFISHDTVEKTVFLTISK